MVCLFLCDLVLAPRLIATTNSKSLLSGSMAVANIDKDHQSPQQALYGCWVFLETTTSKV